MPRFDGIAGMFVAVIRKVAFLRHSGLLHPSLAGCGLTQKEVEPDGSLGLMGAGQFPFRFYADGRAEPGRRHR
jgi:hypothetical protein